MTNEPTFNGTGSSGSHIDARLQALWVGVDVSDAVGIREYVDALDADRALFPDVTPGLPLPDRADLLAQADHLRTCAQCAEATARTFTPRVDLPLSAQPEAEREQAIAAAMRAFDELHPMSSGNAAAERSPVPAKRSWSPFGRKAPVGKGSAGVSVSGGRGVLRPGLALGVAAAVTAATGTFLLQQRSANDSAAVAQVDSTAEVETETLAAAEEIPATEAAAEEAPATEAAATEAVAEATPDAPLEQPAAAAPVPADVTLPEVKGALEASPVPESVEKSSGGTADAAAAGTAAAAIAEAVGSGQTDLPVVTTAAPTVRRDTRKKTANSSTDQVAFDNPTIENLGDAGEFDSLEGARIKVMAVAAAKSRVSKNPKAPETTAPAKEQPSATSCLAAQSNVVGYVSLVVSQKPAIALFGGEPLALIEIVDAATCKPL